MKLYYLFFFLAIIGCSENSPEQGTERIVDAGYFFQSTEKHAFEAKIDSLERMHGVKLFIYTVISEKYYRQENYPEAVFHFLQRKFDSTKTPIVLLFLSYNERAVKIRVNSWGAQHLNNTVCDGLVKNIEEFFVDGRYYLGVDSTINQLGQFAN